MLWIPVLAAGVINGVGHYWGYRTFQPGDTSKNIVPWGILIGGEELHNNHHAFATSARLSNRWWTCEGERRALRDRALSVDWHALKRWLHIDPSTLPAPERDYRERVLEASSTLATIYTMRDELATLWERSTASKEQLVRRLEDWCRRAEASGIEALEVFSRRLRSYRSNSCP